MPSPAVPDPTSFPWPPTPSSAALGDVPQVPGRHPRTDRPIAVSRPLHLLAIPTSVRMSRWHTTDVLKQWGVLDELEWSTLQILSELFGNCSNYAASRLDDPPPVCTLTLRLFRDALCVELADPWPEPPMPQDPRCDDESGRGLRIVAALCSQIKIVSTPPGKTIVAVIPRES